MIESLTDLLKNEETQRDIKSAIEDNRFLVLKKDNNEIGFFIYEYDNEKVWIGDMWIDETYRGTNLLFLRKYFRDKFPNIHKFNWRNRKRGRQVWVS